MKTSNFSIYIIAIFCFALLVILPPSFNPLFAQEISSVEGIDLILSNENPSPNSTITIKAESYVSDLNSSSIVWSLNGSVYQKGIGVTSIQIQTPSLGNKLRVSITANTPEGKILSKSITITPQNVDLILETDGYTPPFFLGKVPLVYQNNYRIIAIPHLTNSSGVEYDPKDLIYQWVKDSKVIQDQSGYGKQVFSYKEEIVPRQRIIEVKVYTRDNENQAKKLISLEAGSPFITFYKNDSLYGTLYNNAIKDKFLLGKNKEISILAVPYGFNNPINKLEYSWMLNSIEQEKLVNNQSITLRTPNQSSGTSNIELTITNIRDILEKAEKTLSVVFSTNTEDNSNQNNFNGI